MITVYSCQPKRFKLAEGVVPSVTTTPYASMTVALQTPSTVLHLQSKSKLRHLLW